jgi:hypothetical protein
MDLTSVVETAGLDEKEAAVYVAGLRSGPDTASSLARSSALKRPTVYFTLGQLMTKGLASMKQTRSTTVYTMVHPRHLLSSLQKKTKDFNEVMPELERLYKSQVHKPSVEVFEGPEGVRKIYFESERYARKPSGVLYFGSMEHFVKPDYMEIMDWWTKVMKNKGYQAREILQSGDTALPNYANAIKKNANPNHQLRVATQGLRFPHNDNLMYGNMIAIFCHFKETFVVRIESESIATSYRSLFELAWKASKPLKNR